MPQLYPLQEHDARTLAGRRGLSLFYEPGCGKTATLIRTAQLAAPSESWPWGVVAPRNALQGEDSWAEALTTWAPGRRNVTLTHWEALERDQVRASLKKCRFLVLDEAQAASNVETATFRNCYDVAARIHTEGGQVVPATGTPVFNGVQELASLFVLAGAMRLDQYNFFKWRYTRPAEGSFSASEAMNVPELRQILSAYSIRRTLPEMGIRLPPLYPVKWRVNVARENPGAEYNRAAADFSNWYRETQGRALPPLARFTTLRRLLSMAKAPTVAAVARQQILLQKNVLIFTEFRDTAEYLHKKLEGSRLLMGGESAGQRVETFAAVRSGPAGRALVATGGSLSAAVNLQALNQVFIVDLPWTPAELDQWFKRTWRNRQTQAVTLAFFLAQGDQAERHVESVLLKKTDMLIKLGLAPTGNLRQIGF